MFKSQVEGRKSPLRTTRAGSFICDAFSQIPWPLRWFLGIFATMLLVWLIFVPGESDVARKALIRANLGRGTWNMLHRLTVKYPKKPTPEQRRDVHDFFRLFSLHYPCEEVRMSVWMLENSVMDTLLSSISVTVRVAFSRNTRRLSH